MIRRTALALLVILGCHQRQMTTDEAMSTLPRYVTIHVTNRNRLDVMVYVYADGRQTRVGLATASTESEFRVPLMTFGAGADYRLIGDPIGMRINVTTEILHARAGDMVIWSLEDSFARSTVVVR
jgi:hypothetical protein